MKSHGIWLWKLSGEKISLNLHYTRLIPFWASQMSGAHLRIFAPRLTLQRFSDGESLTACRRFDQLGICTLYLPYQKWTFYHLCRMVNAWEVESSNLKDRPNLTQHCKQFATTLTSAQVAVLSWHYWCGDGHHKLVTCFGIIRRVQYNERFSLLWEPC